MKTIQTINGPVHIIGGDEPEGTCQECGAKNEELRPYGKGGKLICFTCGMKDKETTSKMFAAQFNAPNQ